MFFTMYWNHVPYNSCTSLIWVLYFNYVSLDWRLGFEQTLQVKCWNFRALKNETHMRASILNTGWCLRLKKSTFKPYHIICQLGSGLDSVDVVKAVFLKPTFRLGATLHYGGEVHRLWILGEFQKLIGQEQHSCPVVVYTMAKIHQRVENIIHGWKNDMDVNMADTF